MQKIKEDRDLMRQFPRRPRFGVRLPSILKLELRWLIRYHLWNLTVYTRIAKQVNTEFSMCWMMLPILAPWFKMNQDLRSLILDLRFQPLCWRIFRSSNPRPGWSQTQRVELESFTSMPPNPLLDWWRLPLLNHLRSAEYWRTIRPKTPKHKPVLEDKTLMVLFKKEPATSFNSNRILRSQLRTLSPLIDHEPHQK